MCSEWANKNIEKLHQKTNKWRRQPNLCDFFFLACLSISQHTVSFPSVWQISAFHHFLWCAHFVAMYRHYDIYNLFESDNKTTYIYTRKTFSKPTKIINGACVRARVCWKINPINIRFLLLRFLFYCCNTKFYNAVKFIQHIHTYTIESKNKKKKKKRQWFQPSTQQQNGNAISLYLFVQLGCLVFVFVCTWKLVKRIS